MNKKLSMILGSVVLVAMTSVTAFAASNKAQKYDPSHKMFESLENLWRNQSFGLHRYEMIRDLFEGTFILPPGHSAERYAESFPNLELGRGNDIDSLKKLVKSMDEGFWYAKVEGAVLLGLRYQRTGEAVIPKVLAVLLKDSNAQVRGAAAFASQYLGKEGVSIALKALADDSIEVKLYAGESLRLLLENP